MNNHEYPDFDAIVSDARMRRSVAISGALASVIGAASLAISRAVEAMTAHSSDKSLARGSGSSNRMPDPTAPR
ncbi:MAG: hypothetical protein ABJA83_16030 [Burkholderiaceae bacterium]